MRFFFVMFPVGPRAGNREVCVQEVDMSRLFRTRPPTEVVDYKFVLPCNTPHGTPAAYTFLDRVENLTQRSYDGGEASEP